MVKNRGIDVFIISQFDIQRLPEFPAPTQQAAEKNNLVSCYVPIYPGSQIWFEYTIEPPHPPKAAYLFKLLINGKVVTAWDCTEKYGYHGKMIYLLEKTEVYQEYPRESVQRRGFKFSSCEVPEVNEDDTADCIEIRVHRIEHRQRIRNWIPERDEGLDEVCGDHLQLINGGILEPGRPQRRYRYQLLDPQDAPFAIFRFLYRTYDYLQRNNILPVPTSSLRSASTTSTAWYEAHSTTTESGGQSEHALGVNESILTEPSQSASSTQPPSTITNPSNHQHTSPPHPHPLATDTYLPPSDSDDSLSVIARDSLEDVSTTAPSLESPRTKRFSFKGNCYASTSPEKPLSPRQRLKKRLVLDLDRAPSVSEKHKRPLSPFTSGGLLRRMVSPDVVRVGMARKREGEGGDEVKMDMVLGRTGSKRGGGGAGVKMAQGGYDGRSWMGFFGRRMNAQEREDVQRVGE